MLGLSVDSHHCLNAWAESLGNITYPLLSDFYPHGQVAKLYGVLRAEGYSERALFVIDKKGIIRYVDVHNIDEQPDNEVLFGVLNEMEPQLAAEYARREAVKEAEEAAKIAAAQASAPAAPVHQEPEKLKMYCTPWCPACKRARLYLQQNNIPYVEIDISRDRNAAKKVREWARGYETTPTFEYQGQVVVEFNQEKVNKLVGL